MPEGTGGVLDEAVFVESPFCDDRPEGQVPELVVIHAISLPRGQYLNGNVRKLFTGAIDPLAHPSFASLEGLRVSSHFFIDREGKLFQFVPTNRRAWHAGVSFYGRRTRVNDFSIGIELEGTDTEPFEEVQYATLEGLVAKLRDLHPSLAVVTGHEDVAPGRKTDPGLGFDWERVRNLGLRLWRLGERVQEGRGFFQSR